MVAEDRHNGDWAAIEEEHTHRQIQTVNRGWQKPDIHIRTNTINHEIKVKSHHIYIPWKLLFVMCLISASPSERFPPARKRSWAAWAYNTTASWRKPAYISTWRTRNIQKHAAQDAVFWSVKHWLISVIYSLKWKFMFLKPI